MSVIDRSDEIILEDLETHDKPFAPGERTTEPTGRPRGVFRRLTHNAGRILLLWLVISGALVYGIYRFVEPTYEAYSMIKVESYEPELFDHSPMARDASQPSYLQSEIESIRSNPVLDLAISSSSIGNHSMIRDSLDPKADLHKTLDIQILPNTHWIRVALESKDPKEAADMVNAVVNAYHETTNDTGVNNLNRFRGRNLSKVLSEDLRRYELGLQKRIEETRRKLLDLAARDDALASKALPEGKVDPAVVKPQDFKSWHSLVNEVEASFLRDDLERFYPMFDQVHRKLESLEFIKEKAGPSIQAVQLAEAPRVPFTDHRMRYIAFAPVGVLLSLLGLFLVFGHDRPRRESAASTRDE